MIEKEPSNITEELTSFLKLPVYTREGILTNGSLNLKRAPRRAPCTFRVFSTSALPRLRTASLLRRGSASQGEVPPPEPLPELLRIDGHRVPNSSTTRHSRECRVILAVAELDLVAER